MSKIGKACIIGDTESLISFFKLVIPKSLYDRFREDVKGSKKVSVLRQGDEFNIAHSEEGGIQYHSANMPYSVELFLCNKDNNPEKYEWDFVLFLFSWPFGTRTQFDLIDNVSNNFKIMKSELRPVRFKAVLYHDENHRISYTDISSLDEALQNALSNINDRIREKDLTSVVETVTVSDVYDFELLFSGGDSTLSGINQITKRNLQLAREEIINFLRYYPVFLFKKVKNSFDEKLFNEKTSYNNVRSSSNLMLSYWNNLKRSSEWKTLYDDIKELYIRTITSFCVWDIKKDSERLISVINERAENEMTVGIKIVSFSGNQLLYEIDLDVKACRVEFKRKVDSFICHTIPAVMEEEFNKKINLYYKD